MRTSGLGNLPPDIQRRKVLSGTSRNSRTRFDDQSGSMSMSGMVCKTDLCRVVLNRHPHSHLSPSAQQSLTDSVAGVRTSISAGPGHGRLSGQLSVSIPPRGSMPALPIQVRAKVHSFEFLYSRNSVGLFCGKYSRDQFARITADLRRLVLEMGSIREVILLLPAV